MLPYLMTMSVAMEADPEDVSEVVRFPEDAIVTEVVLPDMPKIATEAVVFPETEVVIANEADEAVADSVVGATRRRGSEAAEAVHQGARVPQREKAKEKPEVIFYYVKSART